MKKILFIMQWYPTVKSANSICDERIIESLKKNKIEISCLTYKNYNQSTYENINGVKVYRVKRGWLFNKYQKSRDQKGINSRIIKTIRYIILRIRQFLWIPIYPIIEPVITIKLIFKSRRLMKKEKFDLILAEHHGLDTLIAATVLKKENNKSLFIPILWDPLSGKEKPKYLRRTFFNKRIEKIEDFVFSYADKIIAMKSSESLLYKKNKNKPFYKKYVFLDIPRICRHDMNCKDINFIKKNMINIVFAGNLDGVNRNAVPILEYFNQCDIVSKLNMIFFCDGKGKQALSNYIKNFKGTIQVNNFISSNTLNQIYSNADFLLNIGGNNPSMVPSKIFEYMSYGKPIISTYYRDDDASILYLKRYPLSFCLDLRKENYGQLNSFLSSNLETHISFDIVSSLFPENTGEAYGLLITKMLKGG